MKKIFFIFIFLFSNSLFGLEDKVYSSFFGGAIDGYDPVAYFEEGKAVKGSSQYSYQYLGAKWKFSKQEHQQLFIQNPELYLPQYGGYCAFAMSDNRFVSIDGEAWYIEEGKLYLNYNKSVQGYWLENKNELIQQAHMHWENYWSSLRNKH